MLYVSPSLIRWIAIYPLDIAIRPIYNWALQITETIRPGFTIGLYILHTQTLSIEASINQAKMADSFYLWVISYGNFLVVKLKGNGLPP